MGFSIYVAISNNTFKKSIFLSLQYIKSTNMFGFNDRSNELNYANNFNENLNNTIHIC